MDIRHSRWDLFKSLITGYAPVVNVSVWQTDKIKSPRHIKVETGLREGMWIMYGKEIGIITRMYTKGQAEVMLVNEDGTNRLMIRPHRDELAQAKHKEIPAPRRPDKDRATGLGYN